MNIKGKSNTIYTSMLMAEKIKLANFGLVRAALVHWRNKSYQADRW